MKPISIVVLLGSFLSPVCFAAEEKPPVIPRGADAVRYVYTVSVFKPKELDKRRGDEILAALGGDGALEPWGRHYPAAPGVMICYFEVPRVRIVVEFAGGKKYSFNLCESMRVVELPEGAYEILGPAVDRVSKVQASIETDLRNEVISAPRPYVYTLGSVDDGGTLSGVARLFYGDARKWRQIHRANLATIKNPDLVGTGMKIIIPKLD